MLRYKLLLSAALLIGSLGMADMAHAAAQTTKTESAGSVQKEPNQATNVKITDVTNLRSGAGLEYKIIGKAKKGETYPVVGVEGDWYKIALADGGKAYVASWVVSADAPRTSCANPETVAVKNKEPVQKDNLVHIVDNTNLRNGPSTEHDIIGKAKNGDTFQIVGTEGDWYKIALSGTKTAYVAGWVVETKSETKSSSRVVTQSAADSVKQTCNGKVYIYHTHNQESWKNAASNTKGTSFDDPKVNITLVGQYLAQQLQANGIPSIAEEEDFAQNLKDQKLGYGQAYSESRKAVNKAVQTYTDLQYFFDIHRDSDVPRVRTTATINDKAYARILFVIGTGHPDYKKNKQFAETLSERLNKAYPGLSRGVLLKSVKDGDGEYNQSVSPGSLLLEIGGVNNTLEESKRTAKALADVFADYYASLK